MRTYVKRFFPGGLNSPILIVDDEATNRELVAFCLRNSFGSHNILMASNGQEALDIFGEQKNKIVLVISDFQMPVMKGDELFRQLQQSGETMRFLLCSGYMTVPAIKRLMRAGLNGFIQKPFTADEFSWAVLKVLI